MKQRLLIAFLTILVFGAGFAARMWTESEVAVPPAPALGSEFVHTQPGEKRPPPRPVDRSKLIADIEQLRPQIEVYRTRLDEIEAEFEKGFVVLLTSQQRHVYDEKQAEYQKKKADRESRAASAPPQPPLTDEDIAKLRQRPFESAFYKISFSGRLDQTAKDYSLDPKQQEQLHQLFLTRREKFIALIDSTPPPTFRLTYLINSVQRLSDPGQQHQPPPQNATPPPK
jgi:hypothetical protein